MRERTVTVRVRKCWVSCRGLADGVDEVVKSAS